MQEQWQSIDHFPGYHVSDHGRIRTNKSGRILSLNENQYGVVQVGLMRDGEQRHRSVPLLVAKAFLPRQGGAAFDTPINLDGDRHNNHVDNLAWRPRWFAVKYNRQFIEPNDYAIESKIIDLKSGVVSRDSFECAKQYGLLEKDLVLSIVNRTFVWPTYQQFAVVAY